MKRTPWLLVTGFAVACSGAPDPAPAADASPTPADSTPASDAWRAPSGSPVWLGVGNWGWRGVTRDGVAWTDIQNEPPLDGSDHTDDLLRGAGFGDGTFIAVGGSTFATIMVSDDGGDSWDETMHPEFQWLGDVVFADGAWVAGGANGERLASDDGIDWQQTGTWYEGHWRSLAYGNGLVVAVGNAYDGAAITAVSSDNGQSWTEYAVGGTAFSSVAFGDGRFVTISGGAQRCAVSSDGAAWSDCGIVVEQFTGVSVIDGDILVSYTDTPWPAGGYAMFGSDGQLTKHPVDRFPSKVAHADGIYVGIPNSQRLYGDQVDQWTESDDRGGFRDFVVGFLPDASE